MKFILTFLVSIIANSITIASAPEAEMVNALKDYKKALQEGDIQEAIQLTAYSSSIPKDYVERKTKKYSDAMRTGDLKLWIYPTTAKVIDTFGVIIIGDGEAPTPDDPAYRVKDNNEWKILLGVTNWRKLGDTLTDPQLETLNKLKTYYLAKKQSFQESEPPNHE